MIVAHLSAVFFGGWLLLLIVLLMLLSLGMRIYMFSRRRLLFYGYLQAGESWQTWGADAGLAQPLDLLDWLERSGRA